MIRVTRLDDSTIFVNAQKIYSLASTPDTVITFTNHDTLMVKEPVEELSRRIVEYHRLLEPPEETVAKAVGSDPICLDPTP